MNLERITCVVDFSPQGTVVLAHALALAKWHDAALDVVHVPRKRRLGRKNTVTGVQARLANLVTQSNPERVPTSAFALAGHAIPSIVEHVRKRPADLIVVAQAGPRAWSRRRLAPAVARRTRRPLMTIPRTATVDGVRTNFRRIVCAVDDSVEARAALQTALRLAQESGGQVTVLHVVEGFPHDTVYSASSVPRLLEDFDKRAAGIVRRLRTLVPPDALYWCDVDYRVVPGLAGNTIASVASTLRAELVVMGVPPRHWLDVTPSTVAGVLVRAACPVLTVPVPPAAERGGAIAVTAPIPLLTAPGPGEAAAQGSATVLRPA